MAVGWGLLDVLDFRQEGEVFLRAAGGGSLSCLDMNWKLFSNGFSLNRYWR
jgi:hypothetical protein